MMTKSRQFSNAKIMDNVLVCLVKTLMVINVIDVEKVLPIFPNVMNVQSLINGEKIVMIVSVK